MGIGLRLGLIERLRGSSFEGFYPTLQPPLTNQYLLPATIWPMTPQRDHRLRAILDRRQADLTVPKSRDRKCNRVLAWKNTGRFSQTTSSQPSSSSPICSAGAGKWDFLMVQIGRRRKCVGIASLNKAVINTARCASRWRRRPWWRCRKNCWPRWLDQACFGSSR